MTAIRGRPTQHNSDDQQDGSASEEVYDIPVPGRCHVARDSPYCRHVPFMPCYNGSDIAGRLKRALCRGVCSRRPSDSEPRV